MNVHLLSVCGFDDTGFSSKLNDNNSNQKKQQQKLHQKLETRCDSHDKQQIRKHTVQSTNGIYKWKISIVIGCLHLNSVYFLVCALLLMMRQIH